MKYGGGLRLYLCQAAGDPVEDPGEVENVGRPPLPLEVKEAACVAKSRRPLAETAGRDEEGHKFTLPLIGGSKGFAEEGGGPFRFAWGEGKGEREQVRVDGSWRVDPAGEAQPLGCPHGGGSGVNPSQHGRTRAEHHGLYAALPCHASMFGRIAEPLRSFGGCA